MDLSQVIKQLRAEKDELTEQANQIQNAVDILSSLDGQHQQETEEVIQVPEKKVKKFSASARRKMRAAQQRRWAKYHQEKKFHQLGKQPLSMIKKAS